MKRAYQKPNALSLFSNFEEHILASGISGNPTQIECILVHSHMEPGFKDDIHDCENDGYKESYWKTKSETGF